MNFEITATTIVVLFVFISLYFKLFTSVLTYLIGVGTFYLLGFLDTPELLKSFSNEQVAVIIILIIVGNIIKKSTSLAQWLDLIFRKITNYRKFLIRMMTTVTISSAFINNTPIVAILIPYINDWSARRKISSSKLLIPLSFAAILGGATTIIGTSTNLLINGLLVEYGYNSLNFFSFSYVGIPMAIIGLAFLYIFSKSLLPSHKNIADIFYNNRKDYLIEAQINQGAKIIGKSVLEAGLRNLSGLFLAEIIRDDNPIKPVKPDSILKANDILMFVGDISKIEDLIHKFEGLSVVPENEMILSQEKTDIIEIVIPQNSKLIDKRLKELNFRSEYDAVVAAIHRGGEKLQGKLGLIQLKPGDVLLIFAGKDFNSTMLTENDFYLLSKVDEIHNLAPYKQNFLIFGLMGSILVSALGIISLFKALLVFTIFILLLKISSFANLKHLLNVQIIVLAGLAIAFGKAMVNTGTADFIAKYFLALMQPTGLIGLLAGIFIITNLFASYITNFGAVSIMIPISISIAELLVAEGIITTIAPFVLIVASGAIANFITPIGYPTNLMIYEPGGYSFSDFFKIGFPLVLIYLIFSVTILHCIFLA